MELQNLPAEVISNIADHLDRKTCKSFRLVSRQFSDAATKTLFSKLVVRPTNESLKNAMDLGMSDSLRSLPREFSLDFSDNHCYGKYCDCGCDCWFEAAPIEFLEVALKLGLERFFDRVHALEVIWPALDDNPHMNRQCLGSIQSIMHQLAMLIASRRSNHLLRDIQSFNINQIQAGYGLEGEHLSKLKNDIPESIGSLQKLEISARCAWLWEKEEVIKPYHALEVVWLSNTYGHLKTLSLKFDIEWGAVPLFDTSKLQLPGLESLSLQNYVVLYESQVDWILCLTSLKSLTLQCCSLSYLVQVSGFDIVRWQLDCKPWTLLRGYVYDEDYEVGSDSKAEVNVYETGLHWHELCLRISNQLTKLHSLKITGINEASGLINPSFKDSKPPTKHILASGQLYPSKMRKYQSPVHDFIRHLYNVFTDESRFDPLIYVSSNWWHYGQLTNCGPFWHADLDIGTLPHRTFKP